MAVTRQKACHSSAELREKLAQAEAELLIARQELPAAQRKVAKSWVDDDPDYVKAAQVRGSIAFLEDAIEGLRQMADIAQLAELEKAIAERSSAQDVLAREVRGLHIYWQRFDASHRSNHALRDQLSPEHFPAPGVAGGIEFDRRENDAFVAYRSASARHQHEAGEIVKLEKRRDELKVAYPDATANGSH